jgi:hypothetical protein
MVVGVMPNAAGPQRAIRKTLYAISELPHAVTVSGRKDILAAPLGRRKPEVLLGTSVPCTDAPHAIEE